MVDVFLYGFWGNDKKANPQNRTTVHPLHQQKNGRSELPVTRSQPQERSVASLTRKFASITFTIKKTNNHHNKKFSQLHFCSQNSFSFLKLWVLKLNSLN